MSMVSSVLVAGWIGQAVGLVAGNAAERQWPGSGMSIGILSGLVVGIVIGLGTSYSVQLTWGRLAKRPRAVPVKNGI
jgi:hypothetical protein